LFGNHPQIAVIGFTGVDKEGGGACASESGRNFFADVTGFAHAGHNNAASTVEYEFAGFVEVLIDTLTQGAYGVRFYAKGAKP
jgi:hypothetical protein